VLVTTGQDFPKHKVINLDRLNSLPLYLPSWNTLSGRGINSYLNSLSVFPINATYVDHSETMKRMLCKNKDYFGILSEISIREGIDYSGIYNIIKTEPPLLPVKYAISHPVRNLSREFRIFNLEIITQSCIAKPVESVP